MPEKDKTGDGKEIKSIEFEVSELIRKEAAELKEKDNGHREVSRQFVKDCYFANELGDGILYCVINDGKFVFNKRSREWLEFTGAHWKLDILDNSLESVEDVAERYIAEARLLVEDINNASKAGNKSEMDRLKDFQNKIYKRAYRLRSVRGAKNCFHYAHANKINSLKIEGDELDCKPWLLACANGVIDLQSGELLQGRADDYLMKASPIEYQGIDAECPLWEKTVSEICGGNEDMVGYLQRLFGYAITGLTREHILPILWGPMGRNGKGTMIEVISHIMGELAAPVSSELFLLQRNPNASSGPSPDILALRGLRIAFGSETEAGRRFSAAKIKLLSGADQMVGRNPYDRHPTYFDPTHTLFLLTNDKPAAPPDDSAFWERVHLVEFKISFVSRKPVHDHEREADKFLPDKLKKEAPGILGWLVRGCIEWQVRGLDPPDEVKEATASYQRDEDKLTDFIEDCCSVSPELTGGASELYEAFGDWWVKNVNKNVKSIPTQKAFGKMLQRRYKKDKKGVYIYYGIALKPGEFGDGD